MSADSDLKMVLPKMMNYFCWKHQGGSHLNVKGIISCRDYINNLWPVWLCFQWQQIFFLPTPTLTSSQLDRKGEIFRQKWRHENMILKCLSFEGELNEVMCVYINVHLLGIQYIVKQRNLALIKRGEKTKQTYIELCFCFLTQNVLRRQAWWEWCLSCWEQQQLCPLLDAPLPSSADHHTCSSLCSDNDKKKRPSDNQIDEHFSLNQLIKGKMARVCIGLNPPRPDSACKNTCSHIWKLP